MDSSFESGALISPVSRSYGGFKVRLAILTHAQRVSGADRDQCVQRQM